MFKRLRNWLCWVLRLPNPKGDKEEFDRAWEAYQASLKEESCYE